MKWKVHSAEYIKSATRADQAPSSRPAVIFAGRSNVGKSSLLNRLVRHKGLARTSSTPGRTREIVYFNVNGRFNFIDLPGYGYAKVPLEVRRRWGPMIEGFLKRVEGVRLVVLLIDVRRTPGKEDFQMIEWLASRDTPYIFAVTKSDKVGKNELQRRIATLVRAFGLEDDSSLVPVSARTGMGIDDLLGVIGSVLEDE